MNNGRVDVGIGSTGTFEFHNPVAYTASIAGMQPKLPVKTEVYGTIVNVEDLGDKMPGTNKPDYMITIKPKNGYDVRSKRSNIKFVYLDPIE